MLGTLNEDGGPGDRRKQTTVGPRCVVRDTFGRPVCLWDLGVRR